ncbi:TetR family transcriptional regulator [Rhodococcus rhodnii LMG 5362]|uniref:TetR family transcriptional regulator n=2 Tax=Rhodococcus rhodnii TaxID=38312 RepID=R7WHZ7_9NOCA|nr:TetR family transcriptional regulator [Rhodococcus rhodnii LMG 5362]
MQDRALATRASILTSAALHVAERGVAATALTDIVSAVGVTKGALYYHFPSKDYLVDAIVDAGTQAIVHAEKVATDGSHTSDPLERMVFFTHIVADLIERGPVLRAACSIATSDDVPFERRVVLLNTLGDTFARFAVTASDSGAIAPTVDVDALARVLTAMMFGAHRVHITSNEDAALRARLDEFWSLIGCGLGGAATTTRW